MTAGETSIDMLRLGLLAPGEIFGGAERQMLTLCTSLGEHGVKPVVILFHDAALAAALRETGLAPIILPAFGALDLSAVRRLRTELKKAQLNVLHFHGYKAAAHAYLATRNQRIAIVKTEHGAIETRSNALRERSKTALYRAVDAFATRRLRPQVVYVTRELEEVFSAAHRGLSRSVIYNGVELPLVRPKRRPAEYAHTKKNIVITGRLEEVKGVEFAVRALSHEAMPQDVVLHIVGDGPLRGALEQLVEAQGLSGRVAFHGFRQNVYDYLAHADALLMPSMHEGLPYVLLEAMSLGAPAVVSAVGGLQEVLVDGETALLVPPSDPRAIAQSLRRLFETPELRRRLADNALGLVKTSFSASAMGESYLALYLLTLTELTQGDRRSL